ncbi:hypothetical protein PAPYR_2902 [Paratrimastix pyriformis]|uniref:Hemerythrin-like domain-containing protein n=1 Tax=Paratrimastix pyriformis TaxID=342808 RepID=A0ABQ8USI3_9EUKA|nr:hypothetical protein PAPYR_2902 [Paratrimastix pyriformis]
MLREIYHDEDSAKVLLSRADQLEDDASVSDAGSSLGSSHVVGGNTLQSLHNKKKKKKKKKGIEIKLMSRKENLLPHFFLILTGLHLLCLASIVASSVLAFVMMGSLQASVVGLNEMLQMETLSTTVAIHAKVLMSHNMALLEAGGQLLGNETASPLDGTILPTIAETRKLLSDDALLLRRLQTAVYEATMKDGMHTHFELGYTLRGLLDRFVEVALDLANRPFGSDVFLSNAQFLMVNHPGMLEYLKDFGFHYGDTIDSGVAQVEAFLLVLGNFSAAVVLFCVLTFFLKTSFRLGRDRDLAMSQVLAIPRPAIQGMLTSLTAEQLDEAPKIRSSGPEGYSSSAAATPASTPTPTPQPTPPSTPPTASAPVPIPTGLPGLRPLGGGRSSPRPVSVAPPPPAAAPGQPDAAAATRLGIPPWGVPIDLGTGAAPDPDSAASPAASASVLAPPTLDPPASDRAGERSPLLRSVSGRSPFVGPADYPPQVSPDMGPQLTLSGGSGSLNSLAELATSTLVRSPSSEGLVAVQTIQALPPDDGADGAAAPPGSTLVIPLSGGELKAPTPLSLLSGSAAAPGSVLVRAESQPGPAEALERGDDMGGSPPGDDEGKGGLLSFSTRNARAPPYGATGELLAALQAGPDIAAPAGGASSPPPRVAARYMVASADRPSHPNASAGTPAPAGPAGAPKGGKSPSGSVAAPAPRGRAPSGALKAGDSGGSAGAVRSLLRRAQAIPMGVWLRIGLGVLLMVAAIECSAIFTTVALNTLGSIGHPMALCGQQEAMAAELRYLATQLVFNDTLPLLANVPDGRSTNPVLRDLSHMANDRPRLQAMVDLEVTFVERITFVLLYGSKSTFVMGDALLDSYFLEGCSGRFAARERLLDGVQACLLQNSTFCTPGRIQGLDGDFVGLMPLRARFLAAGRKLGTLPPDLLEPDNPYFEFLFSAGRWDLGAGLARWTDSFLEEALEIASQSSTLLTVWTVVDVCGILITYLLLLLPTKPLLWHVAHKTKKMLELFPDDETGCTLEWTDSYQVGVAALDAEHKRLVELGAGLVAALMSGERPDLLRSLASGFMEAVTGAFGAEEQLMEEQRYPKAETHARQHKDTLTKLNRAVENVARGNVLEYGTLDRALRLWLSAHVDTSDRALAKWLATERDIH